MNALLIYPEYPDTFWSFKEIHKFSRAKAMSPPLGLLTLAALLPASWAKKLVDLNVEPLTDDHLKWADLAFVGAMTIQYGSAQKIIERCGRSGLKVVAGGPHFFHEHDQVPGVDHFIVGEAEGLIDEFIRDLENGSPRRVYRAETYPDLTRSPPPLYELIDPRDYAMTAVQYTRGCPYNCEFCDITTRLGRAPRFKSVSQILEELDRIHSLGCRGELLFVDDNFIGHKPPAKKLADAIIPWQKEKGYPFWFTTQASMDLASSPELLDSMARAGFKKVFLGIETTGNESLEECKKHQNRNRDLVQSVRQIQGAGMEVMAGFIIGFDSDPPDIFDELERFIRETGITGAMVGLLSAPPGTALWDRMEKEGRLLGMPSGDNVLDVHSLNFTPAMDRSALIGNYGKLMNNLYRPDAYFNRALTFFETFRPNPEVTGQPLSFQDILSALKIVFYIGLRNKARGHFWSFILKTLIRHRAFFPDAMIAAVTGNHFWRITQIFNPDV